MSTAIAKRKPKNVTSTLPGESKGAIHETKWLISETNGAIHESDAPKLPRLQNPNPDVIDIPLKHLVPHFGNRMITDESVADLAASIAEVGQLEPATVRRLPKDPDDAYHMYELLSGERRHRACSLAGTSVLRCIVVEDSDSQSVVRLAAANSNRKDLNPIERAQLIELMMKPIDKGGSGLDRLAAGRAVGLQSESGVKNTLRLLKLPKSIQDLVSAGELSERAARRLIPFAELPLVMKEIEKTLTDRDAKRHIGDLSDEDYSPYWLTHSIEKHTRPMDKREASMNLIDKQYYRHAPKLFECDDAMLKTFAPIEITVDDEKWQVTSNTKEWDKLQKPLLKEYFEPKAKGAAKQSPKGAAKTTTKAAEQTPAQKAAEEKQRRKQADDRLDHFTLEWTQFAFRCQLSIQADDVKRAITFGYLATAYQAGGNRLGEVVVASYAENGIEIDKSKKSNAYDHYAPLPSDKNTIERASGYLSHMWRLMLWPVLQNPESPSILKAKPSDWAFGGTLPELDRLPRMSSAAVRGLAGYCGISITDFWNDAAREGRAQRQLLAIWLARHTTEQLQALWRELKLAPLKGSVKRSEMVDLLLAEHTPENRLPLPKRLSK